jgi:hypothetical protein
VPEGKEEEEAKMSQKHLQLLPATAPFQNNELFFFTYKYRQTSVL